VLWRSLGVILLARMRCCGRVGANEIRSLGQSFFTKFLYVGLYLGTAPEELGRCYHDVGHWLAYQRIYTPWPPL
jgi:hypothetical protein